MPKTKFGVGDDVKTKGAGGFGPYEGPDPKPGVAYPVELKQCAMKISQAGNLYVNTGWEVADGECKGYMAWHRIVPGENDFAQQRVAQFMQAVCKQNMADIVHDEVEDGGKVNKIGGRNPIGTKSVMFFYRRNRVIEGVSTVEIEVDRLDPEHKLIPGQRKVEQDDEPQWENDPAADDVAEEDEFGATYADASKMTLKDLKALGEDWGVDEADVPKNKAKALAYLVAEGVVEPEPTEEPEDEESEPDETTEEKASEEDEAEESESSEDEEDDEEDDEDAVSLSAAQAMSLMELKKLAEEWESELDLSTYKGPKGKKALISGLIKEGIVEDLSSDEPPF